MSVQTSGTDDAAAGPGRAGAAQPGLGYAQGGAAQPARAPRAMRMLGLVAVCLGVVALAAATFVLSYSAIRAVALQAGITPRFARGYPLLLDAMLVIVLAAVLALRGAGLPSRLLAWLTLLVVVAAAAGADALHAAGHRLPHQTAAITAAVLPWVLVLVAFALLLTMLRHARLRRAVAGAGPLTPAPGSGLPGRDNAASTTPPTLELPVRQTAPPPTAPPANMSAPTMPLATVPSNTVPSTTVPSTTVPSSTVASSTGASTTVPSHAIVKPVLAVPRQASSGEVADAGPEFGGGPQESPELAVDSELAPDDPTTDEGASEPADGTTPYPAESLPQAAYAEPESAAEGAAPEAVDTDSYAAGSYQLDPTAEQADPGASDQPAASDQPGAGNHPADAKAADDGQHSADSQPVDDGPEEDDGPEAEDRLEAEDGLEAEGGPAADQASAAQAGQEDPDMPVFHRMWSSPTPPAGR